MKQLILVLTLFFTTNLIANSPPITNGTNTIIQSHPHSVAIFQNGAYLCQGVLINEQWVLTAKHPFDNNTTLAQFEVVLGRTDLSTNDGITRNISKKVLHPNDPTLPPLDKDVDDIALLALECPVSFTNSIAPATVATFSTYPSSTPDAVVSITGWGRNEDGNLQNILQQINVPMVDANALADEFDEPCPAGGIPRMFVTHHDSKNACNGDSGGPVISAGLVLGIISGGFRCGEVSCADNNGSFHVDTRFYESWIASTILDGPYDDREFNQDVTSQLSQTVRNLTVREDVTLTIKDATVEVYGKVSLREGAKLILDNATLTNTCAKDEWIGVRFSKEASGIELRNGSRIENAEIGIKLRSLPFLGPQPVDSDDDHPYLKMNYSGIKNCDIGIQFGLGKTNSVIDGSAWIADCGTGIKYQNHSGLKINESQFIRNGESIHSIDGYMEVQEGNIFAGGNQTVRGISVEGTLPLASGIQIGVQDPNASFNQFSNIIQAGVVSSGSEHPAAAVVANCNFDNPGSFGAVFTGANEFDFINNNVRNGFIGTFADATGGNINEMNCNLYEDVSQISQLVFKNNEETYFLENHFEGDQNINIDLFAAEVPGEIGSPSNPAANCFSDNATHIMIGGTFGPQVNSFIYNYFDDSGDSNPCQEPENPFGFTAVSTDNQGNHCNGAVGIFNLINPGGNNGGGVVTIDPPYDDPDDACLGCIRDIIDVWINNVENQGGDNPTTSVDESTGLGSPLLPQFEATLHQWINYAVYIALETENYMYGEQVLSSFVTWEWQKRLYALHVISGDINRAKIALNALDVSTTDRALFQEVQYINLKRIEDRGDHNISQTELDRLVAIVDMHVPSSGYARSLYRILTGTMLPIDAPLSGKRNSGKTIVSESAKDLIFPNPSQDYLNFKWSKMIQTITINDLSGRLVKSHNINNKEVKIDISSLQKGVYIATIVDSENIFISRKIIKL